MIDLEKEKYNFEYFCRDYGDISLTSESLKGYKNKKTQKMWTFWKARAKEAQKEISELKAKLAKYESDDTVIVQREPSEKIKNAIDVAIRKSDREKLYSQDSVSHRKSELVYKAMIEAVEKDHE
jgi:hypothetical protein